MGVILNYPWVPVLDCFTGGTTKGFDNEAEYWFMRPSWGEPEKFTLADQPIWFNVANLYYWTGGTGPAWVSDRNLLNQVVQREQPGTLRSMFNWLMGVK